MGIKTKEIEEYFAEIAPQYENKLIESGDFKQIIYKMAEIDERCSLTDEVIQQLYDFVFVKQNGQVCFGAVVGLTLEILKERTSFARFTGFQARSSAQKSIWDRINPMIEVVTTDTMHQMKFIYEQCMEEHLEEELPGDISKEQDEQNILMGVSIEKLTQKVWEMHSLSETEKMDIEILFKCIQSEQNTVTQEGLGELMSLLEQFQIEAMQRQQNKVENSSINDDSKDKEQLKQTEQNQQIKDKHSEESQVDPQIGENEEDIEARTLIQQFYKYDYLQDLIRGIDFLRQQKGHQKAFYEQIGDIMTTVQLLGAKLEGYETLVESQSEQLRKGEDIQMKNEQQASYIQSEMRRLIEFKEDLEASYDALVNDYEILQMECAQQKQQLFQAECTSTVLGQVETQCARLKNELDQMQIKCQQLQTENTHIQEESDKMFLLYQETQSHLDRLELKNEQMEESQALTVAEIQEKHSKDNEILERLKDQSKSTAFKLKILTEEAKNYKAQLQVKEEDYNQLLVQFKLLQTQLQEEIMNRKNLPVYALSNRQSLRPSIKPLSALTQRNSISNLSRNSFQFNQFRNSYIDKGLDNQLETKLPFTSNRISFNYPTRSSMLRDSMRGSSIQSMISSNLSESPSMETSTVQLGTNFDHFWDKFQERMSVINANMKNADSKDADIHADNPDLKNPQFYANFLQFDENELYARDFLGLRDNKKISHVLKNYSDVEDVNDTVCFSDSIYRINNSNERERRILFATSKSIFVLHPRNFKVIRRISIEKIQMMTFLNKSAYLCVISIKQEYDYIIETYRRTDFNIFLLQSLKKRGLPFYEIRFSDEMSVQFRGAKEKVGLCSMGENTLLNRFQGAFKSAQLVGFLELQKANFIKNLFMGDWREQFFVLSNIGLISFKQPGDSKPLLFIPISDAVVLKDPLGVDKKFCIKIQYANSDQQYFLATQSKADQEMWMNSIQKLIRSTMNLNAKKDSFMKKQYLDPSQIIEEQPDE